MVKHSGFTFLEMLVATAIFAMVGLASVGLLQSVSQSNELSQQRSLHLQQLQRTMLMLERDFMQISARHARIDGDAPQKNRLVGERFLLNSEDHGVSFTRDGWRNPGWVLPRSELQLVAYRLQEGQLQRLYSIYVDTVTGSEPLIQVLQEQLTEFEVSYWQDGQWQERWQDSLLPEAVKVRLLHDSFGELERIFVLPDALSAQGGR